MCATPATPHDERVEEVIRVQHPAGSAGDDQHQTLDQEEGGEEVLQHLVGFGDLEGRGRGSRLLVHVHRPQVRLGPQEDPV